jgi:site-specific DNA-methyltransferase (adenine-specific)
MQLNRLINRDCFEVMADMADNSVDTIITDPPYYTTSLKFDKEVKIDFHLFFKEAHRICKPNGAIISFAQQPFATDLIVANRKYFRCEIIWEKTMALGFLNAKKRPLRAHENILVFSENGYCTYNPQKVKTSEKIRKRESAGGAVCSHYNQERFNYTPDGTRYPRSVYKCRNVSRSWDKTAFHPTQKPLDLVKWLVKTYSNPGETVFDPFAGASTTAVAAYETGRNYIAVEKDLNFYTLAQDRLTKVQADLALTI